MKRLSNLYEQIISLDNLHPVSYTHLDVYKRQAQDTLKKEGGKLDDKEKATLRAQIKTLEKKVEVAEAKDASISSAEKNKKKWSDTLKVMNEVCLLYTSRCV